MRIAALLGMLLLTGCAGTGIDFDGNVCGQPVKFTLTDVKDRGVFVGDVTCPQGGGLHVETADSSASAVIQAQADAIAKTAAALTAAMAAAP